MFTVEEINQAHANVKSGADFPAYIQEIKKMGVTGFETWVKDSHTVYSGESGYRAESKPTYPDLDIAGTSDPEQFSRCLQLHQQGKTDYLQFCRDCAATGIEKWIVSLDAMTCIYYDKAGKEVLAETIPGQGNSTDPDPYVMKRKKSLP